MRHATVFYCRDRHGRFKARIDPAHGQPADRIEVGPYDSIYALQERVTFEIASLMGVEEEDEHDAQTS